MNSDAPEAKRRQLRQQLAELVAWMETDDDRPELFGSTDEYEWLLRLTGVAGSLLARHRVDAQGRCEWCARRRSGWRRFMPRWINRTGCHVLSTAWSYATDELAVVWWQLFNLTGERFSLEAVRAWLGAEEQAEDEPDSRPTVRREGRHAQPDDLLAGLRATTTGQPQPVRPYVAPAMPTERFFPLSPNPSAAETEELPKINEP